MEKSTDKHTVIGVLNQNPKLKIIEPPDGGWGWLVVFGSCFNNIFNLSFIIVFAMVYGDMIKDMGEGTKGSALVVNVGLLIGNCFGPVSGMLIKATSNRTVAVVGSVLAALSVIASAYSTALWHLIVIFGIIRGVGLCMLSASSFVAMNSYFKKNRGKAIGFAAVGSGIGQSVMPYVVRFLMDEYSFKGTVVLMGALCLNGVAGALLFQPVEWHLKRRINDSSEEKKMLSNTYSLNLHQGKQSLQNDASALIIRGSLAEISDHEQKNDLSRPSLDREFLSKPDEEVKPFLNASKEGSGPINAYNVLSDFRAHDTFQEENRKSSKNTRLKSIIRNLVSSMDLYLLNDWRFVFVIFSNSLAFASIMNFVILTPFLMKDLLKLDGPQTALVLSVLSGSDVVGRLVVPTITDKFKIKATHSIVFACILIAIVRQIMTYEIGLTTVIILSIFHGLGKTLVFLNQNISVADHCQQDQVPSAVGLYMLAKGIIVLPFGYFAGWIRDYSGDFLICIAVLNSLLILVVLMHLSNMFTTYFSNKSIKNKTNIL